MADVLMTYQEAINYLYNSTPMFQNAGASAYKPGLESTALLSEAFGNPHYGMSCIIVGGTNGKGSTSHTLAAIAQSAGYRVGLFTSPHLVDFRERIRVNGEPVPESFVTSFVEKFLSKECSRTLSPSFFELTTVMALCWFRSRKIDLAVLEVGLGGRLDCTNICDPMLSVITNISLDHTDLLGKTEAEIAREKAGIMRPGRRCIVGKADGEVLDVFRHEAERRGAVLEVIDQKQFTSSELSDGYIRYSDTPYGELRGALTGDCQPENAATVLAVLPHLQKYFKRIHPADVARGFSDVCRLTGLRGRWETLADEPVRVVCDTGHNIGGWRHLGPRLRNISRLRMVVGFVNDKDVEAIMDEMPADAVYYFATPSVRRGRPAAETAEIAARHGLKGRAFATVREACEAARADAAPGDTIFVGGSTFIVADFLASPIF